MKYELKLGDNAETLKQYPDNHFDSIVTDPPYGIEFMGKDWDKHTGALETWNECFRVLKPGGHILAFSASRTYHHLATNIEAVGFEIRDQIMWLYGSGFPKSMNIGKAIDKKLGNERVAVGKRTRNVKPFDDGNGWNSNNTTGNYIYTKGNSEYEGWGTALKPAHEPIVMARKPLSEKSIVDNVLKHNTGGINIDESRVETEDKTQRVNRGVEWGVRNDKSGNEPKVYGSTKGRYPANVMHDGSEEVLEGFPDTKNTKGKSRHEPIVMARKPLSENTVAENVLKHGTGGINIDGCRIGVSGNDPNHRKIDNKNTLGTTFGSKDEIKSVSTGKSQLGEQGRFPANIIHDGSEEVLEGFPNTKSGKDKNPTTKNVSGFFGQDMGYYSKDANYGDSGSAARFFYCPKVSRTERHIGFEQTQATTDSTKSLSNNHPTVKPVALMKYLITLITPKGGKVLDPFNGSGSTGMACVELGYEYTGCELDPDYIEISKARIEAWYAENKPEEVNEYFDKI